MAKASKNPTNGLVNVPVVRQQLNAMQDARDAFRSMVTAQGEYGIQSAQIASATDMLSEKLRVQKLGVKDLVGQYSTLRSVYREQMNLQQMMIQQWRTSATGGMDVDMIIPRGSEGSVRSFTSRLAFMNTVMSSVAENTIKWGKNTQWAGRQLMVGLSLPIAAAAAGMAALSYQLDKSLTQVIKVYGDATSAVQASDEEIRKTSMETTRAMASLYGATSKDTLEIIAQLAATGKEGIDLQQSAAAVTRARMLGELDLQDAMKATITLQSVYNMNAEQTGKAFDYMNAMENQTVLTMQDFVVGIPRISGILKELGGDLQDVGVLMTALKAGGIDANEGATALKSISFHAIGAQAGALEAFKRQTGDDLSELIQQSNAEVIPTLIAMGKAMEELDRQSKIGLITKVFGIHQGSKALTVIDQLINGSEQMQRALEVSGQTEEQWAATREREVAKLTNSISKKLERAWNSVKISFAETGEIFLGMILPIINAVNDLVKGINGLDEGQKQFLAISAVIVGLIGPTVMFIGLLGNLIGNVLKFGTFIAGLGLKFKVMNAEQRAAEILQRKAALGFDVEAAAVQRLTHQLQMMINTMERAAGLTPTPRTPVPNVGIPAGTQGGYDPIRGVHIDSRGQVDPHYQSRLDASRKLAKEEAEIARQSTINSKNWQVINASILGSLSGLGLVGTMFAPSGTWLENVSGIALTAGTLGMVFPKTAERISKSFANMGMKASASLGTTTGKVGQLLSSLKGIVLPIGAVAAAIGAIYYQIQESIDKNVERINRVHSSAKDWGSTLGFVFTEFGESVDKSGQKISNLDGIINDFRNNNKEAADEFEAIRNSDATATEKMNLALLEAVKVRLHGGSIEAAKSAAAAALKMMGSEFDETQLQAQINVELNFENAEQETKKQIDIIRKQIDEAAKGRGSVSGWENFSLNITDRGSAGFLNSTDEQNVRNAARDLWEVYKSASDANKQTAFDYVTKSLTEGLQNQYDAIYNAYKDKFAQQGVNSLQDFVKKYNEQSKSGSRTGFLSDLGLSGDQIKNTVRWMDTLKYSVEEIEKAQGLARGQGWGIVDQQTFANAIGAYGKVRDGIISMTAAQDQYNEHIRSHVIAGKNYTEHEKLLILNLYRAKAGMEAAGNSADGFSDKITQAAEKLGKLNSEASHTPEQMDQFASVMVSAGKNAYSGAMGSVFDEAERIFDDQSDAVMERVKEKNDAISKAIDAQEDARDEAHDKKTKKFESSWNTIMDNFKNKWDARRESVAGAYDAQIKKIEDTVNAEQKAESIRQQIFEAEKVRIQRLSEMYGRNIDFNAAINSGNLDEAAKISNDALATQQSWSADDASIASKSASEKRIEQLEAEKSQIESAKNARLKALEEIESREQKALEARKDREREALDAERKSYQAAFEARREAAEKKARADEKSAQRSIDANKRALDQSLAALRANVPATQTELAKAISEIEKKYQIHGGVMLKNTDTWKNTINRSLVSAVASAAASMSNDIKWEQLGQNAASKMTEGAFGMTIPEFMNWVVNGEAPRNYNPAKIAKNLSGANNKAFAGAYHTGGVIPGRVGKGASMGITPSEYPALLLQGEGVVNRKGMRSLGAQGLEALNKGIGGPDMAGSLGGGFLGSTMAGLIRRGMIGAAARMGANKVAADAGMGGAYEALTGAIKGLSAEQIRNAQTIMATGKSLGASDRDLVIALMTAMQESNLRNLNYGDRDSLGLFQQRNAWGSAAERTNPAAAARMFFLGGHKGQRGLFDFKNRDKMTLSQAAQAVQVSAFPNAYAKWETLARTILGGTAFKSSAFAATGDASKLLGIASRYIGTPYLWGGESPGGFDCSGLVQYVYKQMGISLGRTVRDQIKNGVEVPMSSLLPGDILFNSTLSHEALYAGNGRIIEAPRTGLDVRNVKLTPGRFNRARRILRSANTGGGLPTDDSYAQYLMNQAGGVKGLKIGPKVSPLYNTKISSGYGIRANPITGGSSFHNGVDLSAAAGSAIRSVADGKVLFAGNHGSYGNYTVIQHGNGMITAYGHQDAIKAKIGDLVRSGQIIGTVGTTGATSGPHLHLQAGMGNRWIDPSGKIPGLNVGGLTVSDGLAYLHKDEGVLTKPLTDKLKDGINNLDESTNSRYYFDMRNSTFSKDIDFQKGVENALRAVQSRNGPNRKIGDNR